MIGPFKKTLVVGPLIAGVSLTHQSANKPTGSEAGNGYQVVNNQGMLPRNGRVVVVATCPAGKRVIGGGYVVPTSVDTTDFSRPKGHDAWRVNFKSNGGNGKASVYAICVTAN